MAAKNSMFEPEDTDILQDMYGTDAGRLTEQQEDMFGTGAAAGRCGRGRPEKQGGNGASVGRRGSYGAALGRGHLYGRWK